MKLAFIIVSYNEVFYDSITYKSLMISIKESILSDYKVFIYDNSDKEGWKINPHMTESQTHIYYYHDGNNPGISVAYNRMAEKADEWGAEWIVLFDQDTTLPLNIVPEYINAINKNPEVVLKVPVLYIDDKILSPLRFMFNRGVILKKLPQQLLSLKNYAFVNSGLMIKLSFFNKTGGYNEKIKLDYADFQFIERAKNYTNNFEVISAICQQNFSHNDKNISKALKRFSLYLQDLKNCERHTFKESFFYSLTVFIHTVKLSYVFRSFKFFKMYLAA